MYDVERVITLRNKGPRINILVKTPQIFSAYDGVFCHEIFSLSSEAVESVFNSS